MWTGVLLWLLLLAILVALLALTTRRMSRLAARTRELEQFQRATAALDRRFASVADPLVTALDEIRRRSGDPQELATLLPAASDALRSTLADTRTLRAPRGLADRPAVLVRELERAVRASELVEHGLDALLAARGNRELEAQVSLKRGALNLRHAREAYARVVREIADVEAADLAELAASGASTASGTVPIYRVDGVEVDAEGSFNPRM